MKKNTKKIMEKSIKKNNNKIILWASILTVLLIIVFAWYNNFSINNVSANPDYICKKSVTNYPCSITSCWEWTNLGTRTCYWTKTTEVSYYLVRTTCESWYTQVPNWGNVWWSSWRQWSDYVSGTSSCTIIQSDHIIPTGIVD